MRWPHLTMATGPGDATDQTLRDHARQVTYHYDPAFIEFFARTTDLAKRAMETANDVVIMQGEVVLGMEAAIASMVGPVDRGQASARAGHPPAGGAARRRGG